MYIRAILTAVRASRKNKWGVFSSECWTLINLAFRYGAFTQHIGAISSSNEGTTKTALDFRKKIECVLTSPLIVSRCPQVQFAIEVVENDSFNAFASKLSGERETYVIGLFTGTIQRLLEVTAEPTFIQIIRKHIPQLSAISDAELSLTSFYFCASFVAYHEVGHVVRGHLNFRHRTTGQLGWIENDNPVLLINSQARSSHITECDADNFAGRLLLGTAVECSKLSRDMGLCGTPQQYKSTTQGFRELSCACAGLIFLLFDTEPHCAGDHYPIAPIRLAIALGMFADQLVTEGEKEKLALATALSGLVISQSIANQMGWPRQEIDLASEFSDWQSRFLPEIRSATKTFHKFAPCNQ